MVYLKKASLGGDNQYIWVAVVLSNSQQLFSGCGWPELEGCAGSSYVTSMRDITKLIEFSIWFRNIVTYQDIRVSICVKFSFKFYLILI